MNCLDFRREALTDPYHLTDAAKEHRASCAACGRFYADTMTLDADIRRASKVDAPEGLAARILLDQSLRKNRNKRRRRVYFSIAASLAVIVALAVFQLLTKAPELDRVVVSHVENERGMIQRMTGPVRQPTLDEVLNEIHLNTREPIRHVVFAANCVIKGELVAHLVVEDANRQYTVILIPRRELDKPMEIRQPRWHGVITSNAAGTLAVLTDAANPNIAEVNRIANEFDRAIVRRGARI